MNLTLSGISNEVQEEPKKAFRRKISYTQWSTYAKCPLQWKLKYIDKHQTFTDNINNIFGTAMHETIQDFLEVMYNESVQKANLMDLDMILFDKLSHEWTKSKEKSGVQPAEQYEMESYYQEGCVLLSYLKKKRGKYFPKQDHRLVGIELDLDLPASSENDNVFFVGYLDVILEDTKNHRLKIIDLKTSRMGWNKYAKADKLKASQLVLYKNYYAEQYDYDIKRIDIQYLILRRQIDEDAMYPAPRIQSFIPASGKPTIAKVQKEVDAFVKNAFTESGNYSLDSYYPAVGGKRYKNCKWCPFSDDESLCIKKERIKE